jgi:hypothetical protein
MCGPCCTGLQERAWTASFSWYSPNLRSGVGGVPRVRDTHLGRVLLWLAATVVHSLMFRRQYLAGTGAMASGNSQAYTTFDCAFTEELPAVLTGLGAELPQARTGRK